MYTKNLIPLVGLAALGWLGFSASAAVAQGVPSGGGQDMTPRPIPAPTPAPRPSVLLLTTGQIQTGVIEDDPDGNAYLLKVRGGTFRVDKSRVEHVASSIEDLYRYRAGRLPQGDADEHIKLARWCLEQNLRLQAREQLQAVLNVAPKDPLATLMIKSMDATDEAAANRVRDDDVRQAGAEMPDETNPVNQARVNKALRAYGNTGLPVVFDLPPTLAVKRAKEFAVYIQPVLQRHCASCHNDRYNGSFRLAEIKTRKDMADETIIRANLDATLQLVNTENPGQSPLLTRAIVPHGNNPRPALSGPNDVAYRNLQNWANNLKGASRGGAPAQMVPGADPALTRTSATMPAPAQAPPRSNFAIDRNGKMTPVQTQAADGFGADRSGNVPTGPKAEMEANGFVTDGRAQSVNYQDGRYQGQGGGFPTARNGDAFQAPPGFKPQNSGAPNQPAAFDPSTVPLAPGTPQRLQSMTGRATTPAPVPAPVATAPTAAGELPSLPGAAPAAAKAADDVPPAGGYNANNLPPVADIKELSKNARKRTKLNPAALEAIMKARNGATTPPQP